MTPTNDAESRATFEAWCITERKKRDLHGDQSSLSLDRADEHEDKYANFNTQYAWSGWQARDAEIAAKDARIAELEEQVETLLNDNINKVMTATDAQIDAAIRLDGHDPEHIARLGKQAAKLALMSGELHALREQHDTLIAVHEQTRRELAAREAVILRLCIRHAAATGEMFNPEEEPLPVLAAHTARVKVEALLEAADLCGTLGGDIDIRDPDETKLCANSLEDILRRKADQITKEAQS